VGDDMKIIEHGTPPDAKPITAKCSHCKTVVEFYKSEARVMADRNETYLLIECPVCKKGITKYT